MKKHIYIWLPLFMTMLNSCNGQFKKMRCLEEKLKQLENSDICKVVKISLNDTLNSWIKSGIEGIQVLTKVNWKIDNAVFFNEKFDKAILLVLEQDTNKYQEKRFESDSLSKTALDYISLIYANLEMGEWRFYYQSMPLLVVPRERYNRTTPLTFAELSDIGRKEILKSYFKGINCDYNESFFDRWDIVNLKEKHIKFMKNN